MFVYEPNLSTYHDLLETLKITSPTLFAEQVNFIFTHVILLRTSWQEILIFDLYFSWQDFLNMFFRDVYKPIPSDYNLVLAMLWRHPENINLDKVKVVHYCAAVSIYPTLI
jgi:inositol 3-alpha-galactosyltransferase